MATAESRKALGTADATGIAKAYGLTKKVTSGGGNGGASNVLTSADNGDTPFVDVYSGKWYYDNVTYVYNNGLMNGTSAITFDPEKTMTCRFCTTMK